MKIPFAGFANEEIVESTLMPVWKTYNTNLQGKIFGAKGEVVHAVEIFFIRLHQQYYVYKLSKNRAEA